MTLEELLADAQLADELEVSFGDKGKFKVGDIRGMRKSVASQEANLAGKLKEAMELAGKASELKGQYDALVEQARKSATTAPVASSRTDDIDFDSDPIWGPLVSKRLKPLEAKLEAKAAEYDKALKDMQASNVEMSKIFLNDYYERQWNSIPAERRPKDKKVADYIKTAMERKILNPWGLPDPVEAFNREVEPMERQTLMSDLERTRKELEDTKRQLSAPRMPRPGVAGASPKSSGNNGKTYGTAEEMINDAFADADILSGARPS